MAKLNFVSTTLENCILYTINSIKMTFCHKEHKSYLSSTQKLFFEQQTAQTQKLDDRHEQKCVSYIRKLKRKPESLR